jgi:hypothetical protein
MSALPLKADMERHDRDVSFVPKVINATFGSAVHRDANVVALSASYAPYSSRRVKSFP